MTMIPNWLNYIDVICVIIVALFAWGGFQRGFAAQVGHILTFVLLAVLLFFTYSPILRFLSRLFEQVDEAVFMWLLMVGLLVLSLFAYRLFARFLAKTLMVQMSDRADHLYGMVLGMIRGVLGLLLAMIFLVMLGPHDIEETFGSQSRTGRFVCVRLVPRIRPHLTNPIFQEKTHEWREKLLQQEEAGKLD